MEQGRVGAGLVLEPRYGDGFLPALKRCNAGSAANVAPRSIWTETRKVAKILIVDDHPVNRDATVSLLGGKNHSILEAGDGIEALMIAQSERPEQSRSDPDRRRDAYGGGQGFGQKSCEKQSGSKSPLLFGLRRRPGPRGPATGAGHVVPGKALLRDRN